MHRVSKLCFLHASFAPHMSGLCSSHINVLRLLLVVIDCSIAILVVHYPCVFEELNLEFVLTELRYNTESICSSDLNPFALCVE